MADNITKRKKVSRSLGGNIAMSLFLLICGIFMALPIVYTAICAFKPINELFLYPPRFFVQNPTLDNFITMFQLVANFRVPFLRYLFNSLIVAGIGTFVYVILAALAAYPLAKHKFYGKVFLFNIVVWALLFRPEVTAIPQYIVISKLNLINTYLALMFPALGGTIGVFLMKQFITSFVPDALLEAARIDGASEWKTFWSVVMPMTKPAWLTLTMFTFQLLWNPQGGTQYIYEEPMKVLPVALTQIASVGIARAGASAAIALFLLIPPILVFIFTQSAVIETMSTSGLK